MFYGGDGRDSLKKFGYEGKESARDREDEDIEMITVCSHADRKEPGKRVANMLVTPTGSMQSGPPGFLMSIVSRPRDRTTTKDLKC